jgi:predicted aspartyl protease
MRLLLCVLASALLVGATPAQNDLLTLAAHASGEPWRFHVVSRITASQTQIDEQWPNVVTRRCRGIVCRGTVTDLARGRVAFFSYNETPIQQSAPLDPKQVTLGAVVSYAFTSPQFAEAGGSVVAHAVRRMGSAEVVPFTVTAPHGSPLDALLDPRTGLLAAVAEGRHVVYRYDDQQRVGTLTLPFVTLASDGTREVFDDRHVAADRLALPAGPTVSFLLPSRPVALERPDVPLFSCRVESVEARCLLDTGAMGLAISLELADRLGKQLAGEIQLQGLGTETSGVVRAESLEMGSMRVGPVLAAVLPDTGGSKADILVGADLLARCVVRVDPARGTIAFDPPGSPAGGTALPLAFEGFSPRVPIAMDGEETSLVLDTGDNASIDLAEDFARAHPGLIPAQQNGNVAGVAGRSTRALGQIARVDFAGFSFKNVPGDVTHGATAPASRIGSAFLSRFVFDLDYTELRMSVKRLR